MENLIDKEGREVLRLLLEEHIKFRGTGDIGSFVEGSDSCIRTHRRVRGIGIKTIFGAVKAERTLYSSPGYPSIAPKEAMLNLAENSYSHGLQYRVALEVAKGSFEESIASVGRQTGTVIPKRQAEEIVRNVAKDFDSFYEERGVKALRKTTSSNDLLVLTTDAKGVIMRKSDLREATKKRAEKQKKLNKRLSKGEKKNAKRMAQVASVYSIERYQRSASDILEGKNVSKPPRPEGKRVWASLEHSAQHVITEMFAEASRRDPRHKQDWVILVDGQIHQLELIEKELENQSIKATIILDLIHVIEYLWKASREFHSEASCEGEKWVSRYLMMILEGKAKQVASAIRRSATRKGFKKRKGIDDCASYLHNNAPYLKYDEFLDQGFPIATGVIEGACRHLVKDRMDLTGARWSLAGAEAVLCLRSIYKSKDWDEFWVFHEKASYERNHKTLYANPELLELSRIV